MARPATHIAQLLYLLCFFIPASLCAADVDPGPHPEFPAAITELTIESHGYRLPALLYQANGRGPHPTVLLLHGIPGNEKNLDMAQALRRKGFNVLFFHYRGAWGAEGKYSLLGQPDDIAAALDYLRAPDNAAGLRVDTEKLSLLGHSMGGYAALAAGSRDDKLVCVGAMAPVNVGLVKLGVDIEDRNSLRLLNYADSLYMLEGYSSEKMLQELRAASLEQVDNRAFGSGLRGKSVFLVVGDQDKVTPADPMLNSTVATYRTITGLKLESHIISGDHSFSWSRLQLIGLVRNWMEKECR